MLILSAVEAKSTSTEQSTENNSTVSFDEMKETPPTILPSPDDNPREQDLAIQNMTRKRYILK